MHKRCFVVLYVMSKDEDIRSIADASLVHCQGSCEFKPRCRNLFFFIFFFYLHFLFIFSLICLLLQLFEYKILIINSKLSLLFNYSLPYPIELWLSVASHIKCFRVC